MRQDDDAAHDRRLEHPTDGRILVDGKPIVSVADGVFTVPEKRNMGLVFQNYALCRT